MKNKIKWYRRMYLGARAEKKQVWEYLTDGKLHPRLFVLVYPANRENVLEILPQVELRNPHYQELTLYAVGAAWGKMEAMELAGTIVTETYRATGTTDVAAYLGDDFLDRPEAADGKLYKDWQ